MNIDEEARSADFDFPPRHARDARATVVVPDPVQGRCSGLLRAMSSCFGTVARSDADSFYRTSAADFRQRVVEYIMAGISQCIG